MKLKLTYDIPDSPGYYYWTNFGEHTPTILKVKRSGDKFIASNDEYEFVVEPCNIKKVIKEAKEFGIEPMDGHYYGEEMWAKIPELTLDEKVISPDCY